MLTIAARHLRSHVRDRTALAVVLVAPLALASILLLAPAADRASPPIYGLVNEDPGAVAGAFVDQVADASEPAGGVTIRPYEDRTAARAALEEGDVSAVVVIPDGLSRRVETGVTPRLEVWRSTAEPLAGTLAEAMADRFAADLDASYRSVGVVLGAGRGVRREADVLARAAREFRPAVSLRDIAQQTDRGRPASYVWQAMAVIFALFAGALAAVGLLGDRRQATLPAVRAIPVPPGAMVGGAALATLGLGSVTTGLVWIATTVLLGRSWAPPVGLAVLGLATVLAAVAIHPRRGNGGRLLGPGRRPRGGATTNGVRRRTMLVAVITASLLRVGRDRAGLVLMVVLPFVVLLLAGSPGGGVAAGDVAVGVAGGHGGPLARALLGRLEATPGLAVTVYPDEDRVRAAVQRGEEGGGVVVPAEYDRAVRAGDAVTVMLVADPRAGSRAVVRGAVQRAVAAENAVLQAGQFAAAELGIPVHEAVSAASARDPMVSVVARRAPGLAVARLGGRDVAAGTLVLFVFIAALWSPPLVDDRRSGVGPRLRAAPTSTAVIVLGEGLGRATVAGLQCLLLAGGAWLLLGVRWGSPGAVAAVLTVFCLVATGAAMLMGAVTRSAGQARALALPFGLALGIVGGCLWSLETVAPALRTAGHLTPHAWAVDALREAARADAQPGDVTTPLAVLAAFAMGLLPLAAILSHRALRLGGARAGRR